MTEVVLLGLGVLVATTIGTVTGFGLSTILVPVLALVYPLPETLLFVGIIHWFGDVWKILLFRSAIRWDVLLAFGIPGILASYVGASLVLGVSSAVLAHILGVALVAYAVLMLARPAFRLRPRPLLTAVGGTLSGFLAGVFGLGGAVRTVFLTIFEFPKEVHLVTLGLVALLIDSTRLLTYWQGGTSIPLGLWWGLLLYIPLSFVGAELAKLFVGRLSQMAFRCLVTIALGAVGLLLIFTNLG